MNRTTACCLKCGWNPDEQVRRRALPLVKGADGLLHKDISTKNRQSAGNHILSSDLCRRLRHDGCGRITLTLHPAHGKSLKPVRAGSA